jgi:membrane-associated phospholipid phosphatase
MSVAAAIEPRPTSARQTPRAQRLYRWLTRREHKGRLLCLLVVLVASLVAFAHVVEDYLTRDPLVDWDVRFASWLHEHSSGQLVTFFKVATWAGNSVVLLLLVGAVAAMLARRRRMKDAALLILVLGGAGVVNALLKLLFQRPRPELAFVHLETYSFPSGHAAVSTATFTALAFVIAQRARPRQAVAIWAVAMALILLVGFSRLYLGVHYLSDVLAGTSFGLAWASLCLIAYTLWGDRPLSLRISGRGRRARPHDPSRAQSGTD